MKLNLYGLILLAIVFTANSATFSITSVSTCTNQTAGGFCMRWEQNGSVTQTTSCFPGTTDLYVLQNGEQTIKRMQDIKTGDMILAFSGKENIFTEVIGWLHRKPDSVGEYLEISTGSNSFKTSSYHNIAVLGGSYNFAKDLLNKHLYNGQFVKEIQTVTQRGIYAPMTRSGNYFVKSGDGDKILAHCFAHLKYPQLFEPIVNLIWNSWEIIYGENKSSQIHPAAAWMMDNFAFLVEK